MPGLCCRALTTNTCRLTIKASFSNARRAYTCGGPLRARTFPRTIFSVKQCAYLKRPNGSGLQGQGSFMLDVFLIEMTTTLSLFNGRLSFKKIRDAKWRRPFWEEEGGP